MHQPVTRTATAVKLLAVVWFLGLAIIAHHNPLGSLDSTVLRAMLANRSPAVTAFATTFTNMAGPVWVGIWTVLICGLLTLRDRGVTRALVLLGTVALAGFVCEMLKLAVDRLRPPPMDQIPPREVTMSFPSGHVTGATALAFGAAYLVLVSGRRLMRYVAVVAASSIAIGVAFTRLYLGVHWFSDVIAAIAIATAAALIAPLLVNRGLLWATAHLSDRWRRLSAPQPLSHTKG